METMIPADDPVRLLSAFVEGMDLSELYATYDRVRKNQATPRQMLWCSVKKKYKLNVNFFHNTILNLQSILNSLALFDTYLHIHLEIGIHNGYVS